MGQGEGHITDFSALLPAEFYPNPFLGEPKDASGPRRAGPCWEPVINGYARAHTHTHTHTLALAHSLTHTHSLSLTHTHV